MIEHTQTIRRQQPTNCLSVYDHFVGLEFKGLTIFSETAHLSSIHFLVLVTLLLTLSRYLCTGRSSH